MRSIEGRVALVTGASRGIGRAIALELALAGAKVALNYLTGEAAARTVAGEIAARKAGAVANLSEAAAQVRSEGAMALVAVLDRSAGVQADTPDGADSDVMLIQADVSDNEDVKQMVAKVVEKWGRLDILVNNAGITRDRTMRKLSIEDWHAVLNTNLSGAFHCITAAIPVMTEQKYGRIVNVSSMVAQTGSIGQVNYGAAKAGMIGLTRTAALELAKYNITVNCVCPGYTATEMSARIPPEIREKIEAKIPMGRFAEPEEIAGAVLYIVSRGDYVTGQQINVNGGYYLQ